MKKCTTCNLKKELNEFHKKRDTKDGFNQSCKFCRKKHGKEYRKNNKDKIKQYRKKYYQINKDHYKEYYNLNEDKIKEYFKKYYQINKDHYKESQKEYVQINKDRRNKYLREKRKVDPLYKMKCNLRSRTKIIFKSNGYTKDTKTQEMLGVDWEVCKANIERQFTKGMSWENQGDWHIDHIIPLASANTEQELKKLCHYSNLQPLWAVDNIIKSAKINGQQNRFRF